MPDDDLFYNASVDTLNAFTSYFGIELGHEPPIETLRRVVKAFSTIPYENITKIIKHAECGAPEKSRRLPEEVIRDHIVWGAGGTCFSLTSTLLHLLRGLGWKAERILADRSYGLDTHSALLLWIDERPHLLDPGYLILDPIPVGTGEPQEIRAGSDRLALTPEKGGDRIALSTLRDNSSIYRLTYKISPADEGEFLRAWDASFKWDMMQYPLLTRNAEPARIYLRGSRLQISRGDVVEKAKIRDEELVAAISGHFRIHPSVVARALSVLKQGG